MDGQDVCCNFSLSYYLATDFPYAYKLHRFIFGFGALKAGEGALFKRGLAFAHRAVFPPALACCPYGHRISQGALYRGPLPKGWGRHFLVSGC